VLEERRLKRVLDIRPAAEILPVALAVQVERGEECLGSPVHHMVAGQFDDINAQAIEQPDLLRLTAEAQALLRRVGSGAGLGEGHLIADMQDVRLTQPVADERARVVDALGVHLPGGGAGERRHAGQGQNRQLGWVTIRGRPRDGGADRFHGLRLAGEAEADRKGVGAGIKGAA